MCVLDVNVTVGHDLLRLYSHLRITWNLSSPDCGRLQLARPSVGVTRFKEVLVGIEKHFYDFDTCFFQKFPLSSDL